MAIVRTACTMTLDPGDLEEVTGIFQTFIKDVQEKDTGTLTYCYYIDEDPLLIHVFEAYESSQAHLDHFANIDQEAVGRLLGLVTLSTLHYYGTPSPEEQALLAGFGDIKFHRPLAGIEETATRA
jgi:quinol monooxygenase YgiN